MKVNTSFSNWARSLVGCDGGDIKNSNIWVCGIEWGYGKKKGQSQDEYDQMLRTYYTEKLADEFTEPGKETETIYDISGGTTYQFGRKLAKLYAVIEGKELKEYREVASASNGTEIFKMNLYPIAFPDTSDHYWEKFSLEKVTGIQTKQLYCTWCCLNRFPHFAKLVKDNEPKLIIGTGVSYLTEFALAFGGVGGIEGFERITIAPDSERNGRAREIYVGAIGDSTLLVVTPFFGGQSGLNSDYLIREVGKEIRNRRLK